MLTADIDHILAHTGDLWEQVRGKRIFVTGGTGFFGAWLLESFIQANRRRSLGAEMHILTRDGAVFRRHAPHLANDPSVSLHNGDIRDFDFPGGEFSHVIHAAATTASATFNNIDPLETFDIITRGTRRALEFARACHARSFLFTSSGSVYGAQPDNVPLLDEGYTGNLESACSRSFLGESKRSAECLCTLYADSYGFEVKIARCFSFVGPYLPLDVHYAVGNFIRDGLRGGPVIVKGDGTPLRSYMYAADLAVWLWTILFRGESCRAYNVGSEQAVSIADLARLVARVVSPGMGVDIRQSPQPGAAPSRYLPATKRAQTELGLCSSFDLETAIRRTIAGISDVSGGSSVQHQKG